ncbi:hypothetical protein TSOC_012950 [Tetrabaena socialis]|uniref:Sulfotransferase n=1 Tax=Tetrabaena socialis TaxID=47790 RepID=A0A2J7ZLN6_9CHLO|nr:hypothetical protein TSOC_012950 [Tetrabaena socialis]|eukprot:PNH01177.1 hypothetical protein TSOC_012950 [Tetrabaena socialis]
MRPVELLLVVALVLAGCRKLVPAQILPINASAPATSLAPQIGLFRKDEAENEAALDAHGALRVQEVFLHRLRDVLANETLRASFDAALDVVLASPAQLPLVFNAAPPGSQLLTDGVSGSPAALRSLELAKSIAAMAAPAASPGGAGPALDAAAVTAALRELTQQLAALGPASCHPITRRVVLAALARLQLRIHAPGGSAEAPGAAAAAALRASPELPLLLFRTYRLLYNKHRQGAAAKGAIEFLHVSKSGGTSMCAVADRNGCAAESTTNFGNCMVRRFDDRPRWVSAAVHNQTAALDGWRWYYRYLVRRGERSCEYRDEYMKRKRFTFYSNEFAAHGGLAHPASAHLCPQLLNIILLRHPLDRLVSHVRWIIKVYRTEYGRGFEPFFRGRDADYWRSFAPAAVDNYYARLLLGEAAFYAPTGSLNATHLAAAQLVMLQYDVVLLLEAGDTDELFLKHALGWRVGLASARARVAGSHRAALELAPYDLDELLAANDLDVQLYEFGAAVHQLDGMMFAAVAAAELRPYHAYDDLDPADEAVGKRVKCGYVSRKQHLLTAYGEEAASYERTYTKGFPRVLSPDERVLGQEAMAAVAVNGGSGEALKRWA